MDGRKNKQRLNNSESLAKKYTHIFFDLDNTLWDFRNNSRGAMLETFAMYKLNSVVDFNIFFDIYTRHNHELWDLYRKNEVVKKELIRLRFQNTFEELNIKGISPEEMNETYLNVMPNQKSLNKGSIEFLRYLKFKKYKLYIITNGFKEVQSKKLEVSGLMPFFNKVFISEDIKTPKPDRRIFEYAIKSANAKKMKSLMIGDDWETDILGAVEYGIDAIHFLNNKKVPFDKAEDENKYRSCIFKAGTFRQLQSHF